jgi:hypothetical protein
MPAGNKVAHNLTPTAPLSVMDEREAKRISNAIDRRLAAERAALAKDRTAKLLILGKIRLFFFLFPTQTQNTLTCWSGLNFYRCR